MEPQEDKLKYFQKRKFINYLKSNLPFGYKIYFNYFVTSMCNLSYNKLEAGYDTFEIYPVNENMEWVLIKGSMYEDWFSIKSKSNFKRYAYSDFDFDKTFLSRLLKS
jgi:hypothetical protein